MAPPTWRCSTTREDPKDVRWRMSSPPTQRLRAFVEPLLDALELLHGQGVFHRDISPDNILILPDGRPVLLDFGSRGASSATARNS